MANGRSQPSAWNVLFALRAVRRLMFRTIPQTTISYRDSRLSAGVAGRVRGGDRLPWVTLDGGDDNFTPLASLDWQVHVYGRRGRSSRRRAGSGSGRARLGT